MALKLTIVAALFLLAGCATGWTRESGTYSHEQFRADRSECNKEARVPDPIVFNRIFGDCMYARGYKQVRGFFWQFSD